MEDLLPLVGIVVLIGLVAWLPRRRAKKRRAAFETGATFAVPARLRGSAPPYPDRLRYGNLFAQPGSLVWKPRFGGTPVELGGLRFERAEVRPTQAVQGDVRIFARTRDGVRLEFAASEDNAPLVHDLLRDGPKNAPARVVPRDATGRARRFFDVVPVWALVLLLLGGAWSAVWGYLLTAGPRVFATVVENDGEEYCRVQWNDPLPQEAWVDCFHRDQPGDKVEIFAMPEPFRGEAVDVYLTIRIVPSVAALALVPAFGGIAWRLVRRRRAADRPPMLGAPKPPWDATDLDDDADLPEIRNPGEVRYSTVAAVVRARADLEEWRDEEPRPPRRGPMSSAARVYAMSFLAAGGFPLFFALFVAMATFAYADTVRAAGPTATVTGIVEERTSPFPLLPDDALVRYTVAGEKYEEPLPASGAVDEGDEVQVRYEVADPSDARLADPAVDRAATGLLRTGGLLAALLAFALYRIVRQAVMMRRILRARRAPGTPVRYVLVPDPEGDTAALVFAATGNDPPLAAWPLVEPAEQFLPPVGDATAHGDLAEGHPVVLQVGEHVLWPLGIVEQPDADVVMHLVNGTLLFADDSDSDERDPLAG